MNIEVCPCCSNHCLKDNLSCGRGREYFSGQIANNEVKNINEQVIMDLRQCGHLLHHSKDLNANQLLADFSEEELIKLHELLSKIQK
ncbi:MAG: hypothetical protein NC483_00980 [Ruminococcus sp.]|nr:hypothetical protein [Ruminococcus sp.]